MVSIAPSPSFAPAPSTPRVSSTWVRERLAGFPVTRRRVEAGQRLVSERETAQQFFLVGEGVLAAYKSQASGGERILAFFYPGDLILPGLPRTAWTFTVRATCPASVEAHGLEDILGACSLDPCIGYGLFELACRELNHLVESSGNLRGLSVEARFAAFLLEVAYRLGTPSGRGVSLPLPMTRKQIASYLGLRTETLCRLITRWRGRGLIELSGRRLVKIPEPAALEMLTQDRGSSQDR